MEMSKENIVPDLSGVEHQFKVRKMSAERFNNTKCFAGRWRSIITQKMELSQLKKIEDYYDGDFSMHKTELYIHTLDFFAPDRIINGCLTGWQGFFNLSIRDHNPMIEELLHITSCYIPSLAKDFLFEWKGKKLSDLRFLKKLVKSRTTKPRFLASDVFWKDIVIQLGNKYLHKYLIKSHWIDSFLAVNQLSHFYYTQIIKIFPFDKSLSSREFKNKELHLQQLGVVTALFDLYDIEDCEFTNNPPIDSVCKKFNEEEVSFIKDWSKSGRMMIDEVIKGLKEKKKRNEVA